MCVCEQVSVCVCLCVCVLVCVCLWRLNCPLFPSCGLCSIWGNLAYASLSISGGCRSFQMCCSSVKVEVVGCSRCLFKRSCCSLCCPPFDTLARCCSMSWKVLMELMLIELTLSGFPMATPPPFDSVASFIGPTVRDGGRVQVTVSWFASERDLNKRMNLMQKV